MLKTLVSVFDKIGKAIELLNTDKHNNALELLSETRAELKELCEKHKDRDLEYAYSLLMEALLIDTHRLIELRNFLNHLLFKFHRKRDKYG